MSSAVTKGATAKSKSAAAAMLARSTSKDLPLLPQSRGSMSEGEVEELRVAFNMLDKNKDGQLSVQELQLMLRNFEIHVPDDLVLELFHHCSHTGSGLLTETEFLEFVSSNLSDEKAADNSDDLRAAFKVFDKDNNGFITRDELKTAMELMGETLTDEDIDNMIALADLNKDGKIDYEEFTRLLT